MFSRKFLFVILNSHIVQAFPEWVVSSHYFRDDFKLQLVQIQQVSGFTIDWITDFFEHLSPLHVSPLGIQWSVYPWIEILQFQLYDRPMTVHARPDQVFILQLPVYTKPLNNLLFVVFQLANFPGWVKSPERLERRLQIMRRLLWQRIPNIQNSSSAHGLEVGQSRIHIGKYQIAGLLHPLRVNSSSDVQYLCHPSIYKYQHIKHFL